MADYLQSLGYTPVKQQGRSLWYKSPLRNETDASFKVNTELNQWYDFGIGKGGNIIALAAELYHSENVAYLLERKNEDLRDEIAIRDETIEQLQSNIKQMQVEHQKQMQEVKQSYEAKHRKQSEYIDKILRYFPYVEKLMPMIKYLSEKMGFNDNLIKALCTFKEIPVKGKLYSTMFNQSFSADGAVCSLKEDKEGRFDLRIDGVSHHSWFRRKKDEFMEALGLPTSRRQNRGLKL